MTTKKSTGKEARVLYTIRLEPSIISKIEKIAAKKKVTHAEVSRQLLHAVTSMR